MLAARFEPRIVVSVSLRIVSLAMIFTGLFFLHSDRPVSAAFSPGSAARAAMFRSWARFPHVSACEGAGLPRGCRGGRFKSGIGRYGASDPRHPECLGHRRLARRLDCAGGDAACGLCALLLRNRPQEKGLTPVGADRADIQKGTAINGAAVLRWGHVNKSRMLWRLSAVYFAFGFSYIIYPTFFITHLVW